MNLLKRLFAPKGSVTPEFAAKAEVMVLEEHARQQATRKGAKTKLLPTSKWSWIGPLLLYGYREHYQGAHAKCVYRPVYRDFTHALRNAT